MNTQNVGPNVPPRTETPEKLSSAPLAFRAFPMSAGELRPEGPLKPASSEKKGVTGRRAQAFPFAQKRLKS